MQLSEKQILFQKRVQEYAQVRIKPAAAEIDEQERFPEEILKEMGDMGLMGIPYPKEYGGAGLDYLSYAIAVEEISKVCGSTGLTLAAHTSLGIGPIYTFGSEEQKRKYLPELCSGKTIGAFGLTEPQAGSDAGATLSNVVDKGDHYLLNGTKIYCTNGTFAKYITVSAVTDKSKGTRGISCFILEKGWDGFVVGKKEKKLGVRGSNTVMLHFSDVKIPKSNMLGRENEGFKQMLTTLDAGRISIAAMSLGLAEGAYEASLDYVSKRHNRGQAVVDTQAAQFKLADMYTQIEAARHLIYDSAAKKDAGQSYMRESAMAKLYASEMAARVTSQAIQIHGANGFMCDYPVERMFRDSKLCEIGEGTSEIQRLVIARMLMQEYNLKSA